MQLTPNFTLAELCVSDTARALELTNEPHDERTLLNLAQLAYALQAIRSGAFNDRQPLIITSGYRSPRVNKAVGGVENSAHALGLAADFKVPRTDIRRVAVTVYAFLMDSNLPFDQFILETSRGVVHFSIDPRYRRQVLTQAGGPGTPVVKGLQG